MGGSVAAFTADSQRIDREERMTDKPKRIAAALAAVTRYLEEEMAAAPAAAPAPAPPWIPPGPALWALNGRQTQMQLRNLMQLRAFGRTG